MRNKKNMRNKIRTNIEKHMFIIIIEMISILSLLTSGATATQIIDSTDLIGDVSRPDIDIVQVIISKDSDIYTSQIIVAGNIETTNAQYAVTLNDGTRDRYKIMTAYNVNFSEILENTSINFENDTSKWIYTKIRDTTSSVNGNTLTIVSDFNGIDLSGYTFRKSEANWYAPDMQTLIEHDEVKLNTQISTGNIALNGTATASAFYYWASEEIFTPDKVIDGKYDENVASCDNTVFYNSTSPRTFWVLPDYQTGWVQIDLGTDYAIKRFRWLNTHNRICNDRATTNYHITTSQTGEFADDEVQITSGTMAFSSTPTWQEYTLQNTINTRYVRFYVDGYYGFGGGLNELEIYETSTTPTVSQVIIPYLDTGYKYKVVAFDEGTGFEQPDFDDSGFSVGDASFGIRSCSSNAKTYWSPNTDILIRKEFNLPSGSKNLKVSVAIDNDIQVFINGNDISKGLQIRDGCAIQDSFVFTASDDILKTGNNLLAVRGRDRGEINYVDIQVSADMSTNSTVSIIANPDVHNTTIGTGFTFTANPIGPWGNNIQYRWNIANDKTNPECPEDWTGIGKSISTSAVCIGTHNISVTVSDEKGNIASSSYLMTVAITDVNARTPIIFVPGILGSELEIKETFDPNIYDCSLKKNSYNAGDKVWIDEMLIFSHGLCGDFFDVIQSNKTGQPVYQQIGLNGKLVGIAYDDTTKFFEKNKYFNGTNLFLFPYDWRDNIVDTAKKLDDLIENVKNETGTEQVNIIAHSMGGVVSREYIRDPVRAKKVKSLVELAVPNAGSPLMLSVLLHDTCIIKIDIPLTDSSICVLNPHEQNKLVQNWTGAFELLPSKKYYELYPETEYPFRTLNLANGEKDPPMNYSQLKTYLASLDKNMYVFGIAEEFHNNLDQSFSDNNGNTNGVNIYLIAGSGFPTIGQIIGQYYGTVAAYVDVESTNGDGTVPLKSVTLNQTNNVYYVNKKHGDVPTDEESLEMSLRLLDGNTSTVGIEGISKTPFEFSGAMISAHSPVNLHVYDAQNNHVGIASNGSLEANIPGSIYDEIGESKFIYVPDGGQYRIATNATNEGSFDLKIRKYQVGMMQREVSYINVNQTNLTNTSMSLDTDAPILFVDLYGDGKTIQQVSPTITPTPTVTVTPIPTVTVTPTPTKGDVNGDMQINIVDALFIAQYTVSTRILTSAQLAVADVGNDGNITIVDALFIAQYTVGTRIL